MSLQGSKTSGVIGTKPIIFWAFWHPHKSFFDIFFNWLISFFAPLSVPKLKQDPEKEHGAILKVIEKQREPYDNMSFKAMAGKQGCYRKLAAAVGCDLIEATLQMERQDGLFQKWGIDVPDNLSLPPSQGFAVHVAFPETLLAETGVAKPTNSNDVGLLELDDSKILEKLPKEKVPVIVYFHGGGFLLGNPRVSDGIDLLTQAIQGREKPQFIFIAVRYSKPPENPFPVSPLENCSVMDHLITLGFQNIHIMGASAGGNHALVAGLESYRGRPEQQGTIKSVTAFCPMLNPAGDSLSYYQNQTSSYVPSDWLRWAYRVYLQLPEPPAPTATHRDRLSPEELLAEGSNQTTWPASPWFTSGLRRWAEPAHDLPPFDGSSGPQFILTTNAGDPLHDDGVAMVEALRAAGAKVSHHAHRGSHYIGTKMVSKDHQLVADEWAKVLFET